MEHCNDFRYDLKIGQVGEDMLASILNNKTIEVKRDSWIYKSGNIAIEYESRGKKSGIAKSEAEYWCIIFSGGYNDELMVIVKASRLKEICRKYYKLGKVMSVGDNNTSRVVLIPLNEFMNYK